MRQSFPGPPPRASDPAGSDVDSGYRAGGRACWLGWKAVCAWVLVGAWCATLGCSREELAIPDAQRQQLWAEWRSREERAAQRAEFEATHSSQIEDLRVRLVEKERRAFLSRHRLKRGELDALLHEGDRERWHELPICQVATGVMYQMHSHSLRPESMAPIVPQYTQAACDVRVEGVAILQVIVGPGGVLEAKVLKGLPYDLDEEALRAAESAQWLPALICGKPATVAYTITVEFRLPPTCLS